ncbi:hypothetical protein Dimus_011073 [Dionaea muscipula]
MQNVRESWMNDNGLSNVMELIKRQKWEKLFKRRELVHVDAVKEFYARLTMTHFKKKEVAKSSVRGVEFEFDHLRLTSIVGIPRNNGICEYIKDIGTGENRRRDDEIDAPVEEAEEEEEAENPDFDWEAVVDEAADQGESVLGEKFYDAEDEIQESAAMVEEIPTVASTQQKETEAAGVDPSGPSGHIPDSVMSKLQAEFESARANRIQADFEKAQAENARLLALLQQAKNQPKPLDPTPTYPRFFNPHEPSFIVDDFLKHPDLLLFIALNISITHFDIHYHNYD